MLRSLSTTAARWCPARCAVAILLTMPACSLFAQVPGGQQLARPFRASQHMHGRVAQAQPSAMEGHVIYDGVGPAPQMYGPHDPSYGGYSAGGNHDYQSGPSGMGCGDTCGAYCGNGCGGHGGSCQDGSCCGCNDHYGGGCPDGSYAAMCAWSGCGAPDSSVFVDWLYLRAKGGDVAHAQQQNGIGGAGTVPFGTVGSVESDDDCGIRAGMDLACGDCSSILISYTFFETDAFNGVEPPAITGGGGAVGSLVHHPGAAITASAGPVLGTYEVDYQLADVLYRSELSGGPCHSLNYLVGVQYGDLEQSFGQSGVFSGGQQGVIDTYTSIDFDGGGLKAGLDADRRLGGGFSVYGRLTGALMSGEFHSRYTMNNVSTDSLLARANWKDNRVVTQIEYEVGFGWTCPSEHWRVSSGYMFSHWMNAVTTPVFIDAVQTDNYTDVDDSLSFDGFVTRLECCF
jgi:hypothetical protein